MKLAFGDMKMIKKVVVLQSFMNVFVIFAQENMVNLKTGNNIGKFSLMVLTGTGTYAYRRINEGICGTDRVLVNGLSRDKSGLII